MQAGWLAVAVVVVGCSKSTGPPREQVEADLRNRIPNYVVAACGCMGGPVVNRINSVGDGTANVNVSAGGVFCPPATCDITVRFRYVKENGRWAMAMPMQP